MTENVTAIGAVGVTTNTGTAGTVRTGGWLSTTVTFIVQLVVLPFVSVALKLNGCGPPRESEMLTGGLMLKIAQSSVAAGVKLKVPVQIPGSVLIVRSPQFVNTGNVVSVTRTAGFDVSENVPAPHGPDTVTVYDPASAFCTFVIWRVLVPEPVVITYVEPFPVGPFEIVVMPFFQTTVGAACRRTSSTSKPSTRCRSCCRSAA